MVPGIRPATSAAVEVQKMAMHAEPFVRESRTGSASILTVCPAPGCRALTLGGTCVNHDPVEMPVYPRGRPFVRIAGLEAKP